MSVPAPNGGKQKCYFFKIALSFKPPAFNSFQFILRNNIYLQGFEPKVQSALGLLYLSAIALIALTVSKWISQVNVVYHCGKDDQMALPSGLPKPFALCLFVLIFLFVCFNAYAY